MSDPFVCQLALAGFNFNPIGFQIAAGQLLPISQNAALFSLLGNQLGGDGRSTFALPNMQGNLPIGFGNGPGLSNCVQGETGGSSTVTLLATETPNHNHACSMKSTLADQTAPIAHTLADIKAGNFYTSTATPLTQMATAALPPFVGGNQPHENMMPYLGIYWIIAFRGVFPTRG